jgi:hypothetical protein
VQEVVAPFHEPLQRRAGRVGGRGVTRERRASFEDGRELREPEHVHARRGELDRQRQSVDALGDLGSERGGLGVRLESGSCRARTLEEQLDGTVSSGATGSLTSLATWSASRLVARIRA